MPAIDLARLKKQTARLADLFDQPDAFLRALRETLEYYVNYTVRQAGAVAPSSVLGTYRTPPVILKQIENEIGPLGARQPNQALDLADRLWDEGSLEMRLLAASLLGRLPPQEDRLLARLTAWAQQVRDPSVRAALLTTSLVRLRRETPDRFLELVAEWLNPERQRLWPNGIQALIPLVQDANYHNLPPVFDMLEPILVAAPAVIQNELADLLGALYTASPTETVFFLQQILDDPSATMTATMLRRVTPALPGGLVDAIRTMIKPARPTR